MKIIRIIIKFVICLIGYIISFTLLFVPPRNLNVSYMLICVVLCGISMAFGLLFATDIVSYVNENKLKKQINAMLTHEYKRVDMRFYFCTKTPKFIDNALTQNSVHFFAKRSQENEDTILVNSSRNGIFVENMFEPVKMSYNEFSNYFIIG